MESRSSLTPQVTGRLSQQGKPTLPRESANAVLLREEPLEAGPQSPCELHRHLLGNSETWGVLTPGNGKGAGAAKPLLAGSRSTLCSNLGRSESREWNQNSGKAVTFKAFFQGPASASLALCHKGFITSLNSTTGWGPSIQMYKPAG